MSTSSFVRHRAGGLVLLVALSSCQVFDVFFTGAMEAELKDMGTEVRELKDVTVEEAKTAVNSEIDLLAVVGAPNDYRCAWVRLQGTVLDMTSTGPSVGYLGTTALPLPDEPVIMLFIWSEDYPPGTVVVATGKILCAQPYVTKPSGELNRQVVLLVPKEVEVVSAESESPH